MSKNNKKNPSGAGERSPKRATQRDVRATIEAIAFEGFATHGYSGTSVEEIVSAAGVTKPMLYYYFRSKEGLYIHVLEKTKARLETIPAPITDVDLDAVNAAKTFGERVVAHYLAEPFAARIALRQLIDSAAVPAGGFDIVAEFENLRQQAARLIKSGITGGQIEGDAEVLSQVLISLVAAEILFRIDQQVKPAKGRSVGEVIGKMLAKHRVAR